MGGRLGTVKLGRCQWNGGRREPIVRGGAGAVRSPEGYLGGPETRVMVLVCDPPDASVQPSWMV